MTRNLDRIGGLETATPSRSSSACRRSYPIDGRATPVSPGTAIPYKVPDMYGRPWAKIWEEYHEQGHAAARGRRHLQLRLAHRPKPRPRLATVRRGFGGGSPEAKR